MAKLIEVADGPALPPLKLLTRAVEMKNAEGFGLCIHRTAAFVFDVPGAALIFATFKESDNPGGPQESPVPFVHCFAVYRGLAYAPTTIERAGGKLRPMNLKGYLELNGARDFHELTRPELLRLDRLHGLKRALRLNVACKGGVSFGRTLLDAAGVNWVDCGAGGILPAGEGVE